MGSSRYCFPMNNQGFVFNVFSVMLFSFMTTTCPTTGPFRDCYQVRQAGHKTSGMYLLKTDRSDRLIQAWCEHGLDNGGWTVLQRRRDGSVNFFRNWENYKVGWRSFFIGVAGWRQCLIINRPNIVIWENSTQWLHYSLSDPVSEVHFVGHKPNTSSTAWE